MHFADAATLGTTRRTRDGYLVADARIARAGLQTYHGSELGRPDLGEVQVYRPADEVFSHDAMASFAHKPIVVTHPSVMVDASNWREYSAGHTTSEIARDGDFLRVPLMVADKAAIDGIDGGTRELSAGYSATIEWADGTTADGQAYQATMRNIRANHVAIVSKGRAGPECRIGDGWTTTPPQEKPAMADTTRAVLVDGVTYHLADQGAQLVERLQAQVADARTKLDSKDGQIAALTSAHTGAIAAKDGEIAALAASHAGTVSAKDGEIAALTARIPDSAALDAQIEARLGVIAVARRALGDAYDPKGKSDADMRLAVVTKRLGDTQVAGKPVQWVDAAFEAFALADAATGAADPLREALRDGVARPGAVKDEADIYEARMAARWKETV